MNFMKMTDLYEVISENQNIRVIKMDGYVILYDGVKEKISEDCFDYHVYDVWVNNNKLVIFLY